MKIADSIEMGIRALDKVYGREWPFWINLDTFDLSDGGYCVLGQIEDRVGDGDLAEEEIAQSWDWKFKTGYERGAIRLFLKDAEEAKEYATRRHLFEGSLGLMALFGSTNARSSVVAKIMGFDIHGGTEQYMRAYKRREEVWRRRIVELREERKELTPA